MISKSDVFATTRHRWNTNEEIASILICFDKHEDWHSKEVEIRYADAANVCLSRILARHYDSHAFPRFSNCNTFVHVDAVCMLNDIDCAFINLFPGSSSLLKQAQKWLHDAVQPETGEISAGWLLLEETEGR